MPKLAPIPFSHKTATGEKLKFDAQVSVDSDGTFSIELPDDLYAHAEEFYSYPKHPTITLRIVRVPRVGYRKCVLCSSLSAAKLFVEAVIEDFMKVETTEELVIAYRYQCGLHYWQNPDGSIWPNGCMGDADREKGGWVGVGHRSKDVEGGITIGAVVYKKLTHKRGDVVNVEYEFWRPRSNRRDEEDNVKNYLNFISPISTVNPGHAESGWTIMPYSDRAAEFFYNTILSLCKADQQLRKFFVKHENIVAAIESGAPLQLK